MVRAQHVCIFAEYVPVLGIVFARWDKDQCFIVAQTKIKDDFPLLVSNDRVMNDDRAESFRVFDVEEADASNMEYMGTKQKFWLNHPLLGRSLFKYARPDTGEDWSEKIAEQCALLLGLPCAQYELAYSNGKKGTLTPSLVPDVGTLRHGNELLGEYIEGYPAAETARKFGVSQHTLTAVMMSLEAYRAEIPPHKLWTPVAGIETAQELFVGYLLFDVWIGNTDRHHENWAVVEAVSYTQKTALRYLAPTYDHATSLGCHLTDAEREERLTTRDHRRTVKAYVEKARSALYIDAMQSKPMKTLEAFMEARQHYPDAAERWLSQLADVSMETIDRVFARIPEGGISSVALQFATEVLRVNRHRLLETKQ